MVRVTCLSPTIKLLLLFCSCSLKLLIFKTFDQQLNLLLEANIEHKHTKQQTRTTKNNIPNNKGLKENRVRL
jgi:hypothetical protein